MGFQVLKAIALFVCAHPRHATYLYGVGVHSLLTLSPMGSRVEGCVF